MTTRPDFPTVIDNSLMSSFRSCPRKCELEYFHHWKPRDKNVHLHAGAAYAAGHEATRLAYYRDGASPDEALAYGMHALLTHYGDFQCPLESAKSAERTAGALEFYYDRYPLEFDPAKPISLPGGALGVEWNATEPLQITHPVTGDPLLYTGRMDMICSFEGMILGEDDKTTSSLGASWGRQWDLRSQFTGYVWLAAQAGLKLDGFLIRGVSILKTKYDTQQAITYRPKWQLDRWYDQLHRDLARMIRLWEQGFWDAAFDHACEEFGGCIFKAPCQMRDPLPLLQQQYQQRQWNPVTRTEVPFNQPQGE